MPINPEDFTPFIAESDTTSLIVAIVDCFLYYGNTEQLIVLLTQPKRFGMDTPTIDREGAIVKRGDALAFAPLAPSP